MKSTLEGLSSRLNEEEWITELEDRVVEIIMAEQKKEKKVKRNEDSLRDLWDNIKSDHIHIIGVPEGEERDKGPEKISEEVIAETLPNWARKQSPNSKKTREYHTGLTCRGTHQDI